MIIRSEGGGPVKQPWFFGLTACWIGSALDLLFSFRLKKKTPVSLLTFRSRYRPLWGAGPNIKFSNQKISNHSISPEDQSTEPLPPIIMASSVEDGSQTKKIQQAHVPLLAMWKATSTWIHQILWKVKSFNLFSHFFEVVFSSSNLTENSGWE